MKDIITINGFTYSPDLTTVIAVEKDITSLDGMQRGVCYIGKMAFAGCSNLREVRLPETVIGIDDFAFCDCENLIDVHFPFNIEYISPLAFTYLDKEKPFYNLNINAIIPIEAYLKFTFLTPQFVSESCYEECGFTMDDLMRVEGWNEHDGLPVYVDEDELYRMVIMDHLQDEYIVGELTEADAEKEADNLRGIYQQVRDRLYEEIIGDALSGSDFLQTGRHGIVNNIGESCHALIEHRIKVWLKQEPEKRPMEILYRAIKNAILMGFIPPTQWDKPDNKEFYGEKLFYYLRSQYEDDFKLFYSIVFQGYDEMLETYYDKLSQIDVKDVLQQFLLCYKQYGYPINVQSLKKIVRLCMKLMFHIGYSYGIHYRRSNTHAKELELFSEEEMKGGVSTDFFEIYEKEYLYFMQVVSRLDDAAFYILSKEYERERQVFCKDMYYLHSLPEQILSSTQFNALGEMIRLRHYYYNHFFKFQKPQIIVSSSFKNAQRRFMETISNNNYVCTDWVTPYNPDIH